MGSAGDSLGDEGLLLLEQLEQLLLGADVPPDAAVDVVEVADDRALLGEGRKTYYEVGYKRCRHALLPAAPRIACAHLTKGVVRMRYRNRGETAG